MPKPNIDYDKLAQEAGATGGVDYDALAREAGGQEAVATVAQPTAESKPDSLIGGLYRRGVDTLRGLGNLAAPPQSGSEWGEAAVSPLLVPLGRMARGYVQSVPAGLKQARQYASEAHRLPSGNTEMKALDYARSGLTALGALNPLTSGTVENVNRLSDEGRLNEAAGQGLFDAGMLGISGSGRMLKPLSNAMKEGGAQIIDRTVGLRQPDVARGAEPGRAYLEGGGGPALTLKSLGQKARKIQSQTGKEIGNTLAQSNQVIPAVDVFGRVMEPINKLKSLQSGPGGTGITPSLQAYEDQLLPTISSANARGGFTPLELFTEMKKPIAENTRWNDPTMFDLNQVRQQNVGALGDMLTDAEPSLKPLNKIYQGTYKLANRAEQRSATGQGGLSNITGHLGRIATGAGIGYATHNPLLAVLPELLNTVPAKTALASGLFYGGKSLPSISAALPAVSAAVLSPKRKSENEKER